MCQEGITHSPPHSKEMGFDRCNGNPNCASLPLPGTGKREGREYTKPFQQLSSRPFTENELKNTSRNPAVWCCTQ